MKDDDLQKLSELLGKEIDALPKDGKEHSISITVGGNNSGNISLGGTQIVFNSQGQKRTWADLAVSELLNHLAHWKAQWWSGWRGFWLNAPCLLLMLMLALMAVGLLSGWLLSLGPQTMPYVLAPTIILMAILSTWMMRIRRVEGRLMQDSQAYIDTIEAELRRRR
ncbi:hypothetical protein CW360_14100 [Pseudomonas fluvialis]|uniref:Uncharacterized protein n=1 Tax=Pseudomonas fluvialis TaxID=1793966 RepID=A0A2I0CMR0_9PSED|nr:hypothetical protein [Pseudomonas pharmacofabricae]PKF70427.1 hypothetical protein CW360_14100 [Pseudomonas pharmacofabricae]